MTITVTITVTEKKTVTSSPESNDLARGKRRVTGHKRRGEDARKRKGGCTQGGRRIRTGRKENIHKPPAKHEK